MLIGWKRKYERAYEEIVFWRDYYSKLASGLQGKDEDYSKHYYEVYKAQEFALSGILKTMDKIRRA